MKIAITGAGGNLGQLTLTHTSKRWTADHIVAVTRTPAKLAGFAAKGVDVRQADYEDAASLLQAFNGIDTLLLISTSAAGVAAPRQEQCAVACAAKAGIRRIVYTGTLSPGPEARFEAGRTCYATERAIEATGIDYVFFRNSMYFETIPLFVGSAIDDGQIHYPAGTGRVSFCSRYDIAEALANVLISAAHRNVCYPITGTEALSFADLADLLRTERGLDATYTDIVPTKFVEGLRAAGLPDDDVIFMDSMAASIRENEFATINDTLGKLLGRSPLSAREYLATWHS